MLDVWLLYLMLGRTLRGGVDLYGNGNRSYGMVDRETMGLADEALVIRVVGCVV